ncbi:YxeA family protein [uncultured Vagococcus sp.]|uniref:YxeA family protein n=1 Tax=uncultured Vagococcus sp. TaxID=189676 RepID=UPI0028D1EBDA|nr:YxeA family protein [uncultured Vagococcus sp.]
MLRHTVAFLIKTILTLTVITGLFGAFTLATQQETGPFYGLMDRYNILIDWQPLYVKTNNQGTIETTGYRYTQVAYTTDGDSQDVSYDTSEKLQHHHYLKLTAKGRYVQHYEEINKSEVPKKALERLNS